ncbi:MAG: ornithine carbamoyltransferase [Ponticaulis sp.]|nr:ornithine carbamoyltransferase [Ponticaulis sp.]|tara:strand:- start:86778 stop:87698 length:921 start_codon:yes stop_codon:yes gene_type:complete
MKHFLDLIDIPASELRAILDDAKASRAARVGWPKGKVDAGAPLADHVLAMIFEKSSTRTRTSFDVGMRQLGGQTMFMTSSDMQLGRGETIEDTAQVLSRFVDIVMIRANNHDDVVNFAKAGSVPVVNGLTDKSHPCQIMADLQTLEERGLDLKGARIAWVGDGNNVCASFIDATPKFGFSLAVATPAGYSPDMARVEQARSEQGRVDLYDSAEAAVSSADVVVADTFVSMGDEDAEKRLSDLAPFMVDDNLMGKANGGAVFLHCLPAHRGEEVTASVIDGPQSAVFDEAENRLHAQKAILKWCLET